MKKLFVMFVVSVSMIITSSFMTSCQKIVDGGPQKGVTNSNTKRDYAILYKADLLKATSIGNQIFEKWDDQQGRSYIANYGQFYTVQVYVYLGLDDFGRMIQGDSPSQVIVSEADITKMQSYLFSSKKVMKVGMYFGSLAGERVRETIYFMEGN